VGDSVQQPYIIDLDLLNLFFPHCYVHRLDSFHRTRRLALLGFGLLVGLFYFLKQVLVLSLDLQVLFLHHLILFGVLLKQRSVRLIGVMVKRLQEL
jgi:hypothetical protein